MIQYTSGDILKCEADAIVNTVNCVGVMGRGIALQFKNAYPENFKVYEQACQLKEVTPGKMLVYPTGQLTPPYYIINFPTKRHWKGKSKIEDIDSGLDALVATVQQYNLTSIAIPPLGSGLGGLDWNEVKPRIVKAFEVLPRIQVILFEPKGAPESDTMKRVKEIPKMTAGRAALLALVYQYLRGLLDPTLCLIEIHKLMYFMQMAGEPLRLNYVKHHYGPYAENLRHVLNAIEGYYIKGYADGGDEPYKEIEPLPQAIEDATQFLTQHQDTQARLDRVSQLVEGFESPAGLELLATTHWVVAHEQCQDLPQVISHIHQWNRRKQQFTDRQIGIAFERLSQHGWI